MAPLRFHHGSPQRDTEGDSRRSSPRGKKAATVMLFMGLLFLLLPSLLAAKGEPDFITISFGRAVQGVRDIVSAFGDDGRSASGGVRTIDLPAGDNEIPVTPPEEGTYFNAGDSRPIAETSDSVVATPAVPKPSGFRYVRQAALTEEEQVIYDRLAGCLLSHAESVPDLDPAADVDKIVTAIQQDYPEIFWFIGQYGTSTKLINDQPVSMTFQPSYIMDEEESARLRVQIDAWEAQCLSGLSESASDYDKVLYIYSYMAAHVDYGPNSNHQAGSDGQPSVYNSIVHVMADGYGVCGDYAKTVQYLLNRLGIDCAYIIGQSKNAAHAWNLVWPDGVPTWIDATWGDPLMNGGEQNTVPNYVYFGLTTADLMRNHIIDPAVPVPDCTSYAYNYFHRNGLYIRKYDEKTVTDAMVRALRIDEDRVRLRFSDEAWQEARTQLLDQPQEKLSPILREAITQSGSQAAWSGFQYMMDDEFCSITIGRKE